MWGKHSSTIIKADGKGYYAHLPAIFIYHDLNFSFFDEIENTYGNEHLFYDYRKTDGENTYNKYFAGTAVLMLPFFAIGHLVTLFSGETVDGYSHWYQLSISWAALFYLLATLLVMRQVLRRFKIRDKIIGLSLLAIVFGTNWYYYILAEPAMSHVYSVFLISLFFWQLLNWVKQGSNNHLVYLALLLGLIIWVRPVNGMVLLAVPLAFHSFYSFRIKVWELFKKVKLWPIALIPGLIVFAQLIIYKIQTGNFLIYSYEEEGFNFLHPEMWKILFSYKKGLFVYTPLLLIASLFNYFLWKRNKYRGVYSVLFFLTITYLLSSWWNWYYGGSFSSRAYIEYYIFFLIPLAVGVNDLRIRTIKYSVVGLIIVLILFCQFQTYQYRYMVIHWDNMTKEKYWDVFLNVDFLK